MTQQREMRTFSIMWFGQLVSLVGSGLTSFALGVWVYQSTQSVTQLSLIALFTVLPGMLIAPIAGVMVDQWNRRMTMLVSDTGSAVITALIATLLFTNNLTIWAIYIATSLGSILAAFQRPAYNAAVAQILTAQQLDRANGMVQISLALSQLIAPALAGFLVGMIGLEGIIIIDAVTFVCGFVTLVLIRIPSPAQSDDVHQNTMWKKITAGLVYIRQRPGLMGLLGFFALVNFIGGIVGILVTPLVLSFATAATLGTILSIGGSGMVFGSIAMSVFGAPRRRIYGVLGFLLLSGFSIMLAGVRTSAVLITVAAFGFYFSIPFVNGSATAILQSKVETSLQGRIFATLDMVASSMLPVAYLIAGPLSDFVLEPLLAPGGKLSSSVGLVLGTGPGRGIGLLFILCGLLMVCATVAGFVYPRIRLLEDELPTVNTLDTGVQSADPDLRSALPGQHDLPSA